MTDADKILGDVLLSESEVVGVALYYDDLCEIVILEMSRLAALICFNGRNLAQGYHYLGLL